jgi:hypothetical protein
VGPLLDFIKRVQWSIELVQDRPQTSLNLVGIRHEESTSIIPGKKCLVLVN